MQITSETVEPRQVRLTIVVPESRMDRALHKAAQDLGRRVKVKGYRPGKIPVKAVASVVGEETIQEEAFEHLARDVVESAIQAEELVPSAPAQVEVASREPLTLKVLVPLEPEVSLSDYRTELRLEEATPREISEEDVDAVLEMSRQELAYLEPVERAAKEGDVVTLSVVGRTLDDKVVFEDDALTFRLTTEGVASSLLPPASESHVVGHAPGELYDFTVSYPDDWSQPELQGRAVTFGTKMVSVAELAMPELDDDFATQISDAETIDELRERVREGLEARAVVDAREAYAEAVLARLVELAQISYPPRLLEEEQARIIADLRDRVERQGLAWERWLEMRGLDEDGLWSETEEEARDRLERRLALGAFVAAEGIAVEDEEVAAAVRDMKAAATPRERRELPKDKELRSRAGSQMLADRTLARLLAVAHGETSVPPDERRAPTTQPDEAPSSETVEPEGLASAEKEPAGQAGPGDGAEVPVPTRRESAGQATPEHESEDPTGHEHASGETSGAAKPS